MKFKKTITSILISLFLTGCDTWQVKSDVIESANNLKSEKLISILAQYGWVKTSCYFLDTDKDICFTKANCFQLVVTPKPDDSTIKISAVAERGQPAPQKCLDEARRLIEKDLNGKR